MMRRLLLICVGGILIFSCKKEVPHMPPAKLAPILADLHAADAYSNIVRDSSMPSMGKNYDSLARWTLQIFARHSVSRADFSQSMDWYRNHPVALDSLYAAVIPILERAKKK